MSLKALKKVKSPDRIVNQLQENISQALEQVLVAKIISGRILEDISITSGTKKTVNHGLGRKITGWIVIKKSANANVWDSQSTNTRSEQTLVLNASANCTVSVWVF